MCEFTSITKMNQLAVTLMMFAGLLPGIDAIAGSPNETEIYKAKITRISDGDTIAVTKTDGKKIKIRMVAMDTAELHYPIDGHMYSQGYWAEEATRQLQKLLPIDETAEVHAFGTDKYGRVLASVFVDGKDINLEMVRSGMAVTYMICDGSECADNIDIKNQLSDYSSACQEAVDAKRGIFSAKDGLSELPFEFRLRISGRDPYLYVGSINTLKYVDPARFPEVDACNRVFLKSKTIAEDLGFTFKPVDESNLPFFLSNFSVSGF